MMQATVQGVVVWVNCSHGKTKILLLDYDSVRETDSYSCEGLTQYTKDL